MGKNACALVLGSYINGYSIIRELHEKGIEDIILFDSLRGLASFSNKIKKFVLYDGSVENLYGNLKKLNNDYEMIVVFPSSDFDLKNLYTLYNKISSFCFLPFNYSNLLECEDKFNQYSFCEKFGIPYPKTILLKCTSDLNNISLLQFPVLLKPTRREDINSDIFRNLQIRTLNDLKNNLEKIENVLSQGITLLASEIIPGDGSNIYAYVGYRNKSGNILNEWTGKKLSQFPTNFGVFASASNKAPEIILHQGRKLLIGMDIIGIAEPEFKYDYRDKKYKLMEVNLRSMMWNRVGTLSGVNLQYTQYLDAIGKKVERQLQNKDQDIHLVYFKHEIVNLVTRKKYYNTFIRNIFKSNRTYFMVFDINDIKPFLVDCIYFIKKVVEICLKI